jgi:sigma-B regulation protein RsbU (phosphoserine phosphatase)
MGYEDHGRERSVSLPSSTSCHYRTKMATATGDRLKVLTAPPLIHNSSSFVFASFAARMSVRRPALDDHLRVRHPPALPLSLAYVVIVHCAVDVRLLIRQGTRYALLANPSTLSVLRHLAGLRSRAFPASRPSAQRRHCPNSRHRPHLLSSDSDFTRLQEKIDQRFFRRPTH